MKDLAEIIPPVAGPPTDQVVRANYIGAPGFFNLNQLCRCLAEAYGPHIYLVGSSLTRRDYRDVDIRCILDDGDYARMFPGISDTPHRSALWSLTCSAISLWLSQHTGLPIDFQIQPMTEANTQYDGPRHALGLFYDSGMK